MRLAMLYGGADTGGKMARSRLKITIFASGRDQERFGAVLLYA
jgi:hypothetical protein